MATIQKRETKQGEFIYRVQVRLRGFPSVGASFRRKTDAKKWAQETEVAIREGRHFKTTEAKRHTLGEMLDRYIKSVLPRKKPSSRHTQENQLLWWKKRFGEYLLSDVAPAVVAQGRDELAEGITRFGTPRSPSTVTRYLAALSHCYTIAIREWQWCENNPVQKIIKPKESKGRLRYLSDEERDSLLKACAESKNLCLHDVVLLAICTGMRRSEIMGLTWDKLDFRRQTITLKPEDTKNEERRTVPLVGPALEALKKRSKFRRIDSPYVFPAPFRHDQSPKPIDIENAWRYARKRAKLVDFRFHDLRHSCASYLAMNGASLPEIAAVLGHKTLAMTSRYAHLSNSHVSGVVERMTSAVFDVQESKVRRGKKNAR